MRKLIQTCLVLTLVLALAFGAFSASMIGTGVPGPQPNVGWNSGISSFAPATTVAFFYPVIQPCIGWNT